MGSTHLSLHIHLIFGTKNHEPLIAKAWRPRLHAYMGGILRSLHAVPEAVGGVEDHVHLLAGFRATERLCDLMRELKSSSSRWVHEEIGIPQFAWQEGYGAFTVSASQREAVRRYIEGQDEHHRKRSFREEYLVQASPGSGNISTFGYPSYNEEGSIATWNQTIGRGAQVSYSLGYDNTLALCTCCSSWRKGGIRKSSKIRCSGRFGRCYS